MAEVIDVVAAALEFTKVFLELKEISTSSAHAPEELHELIEELNLTDDILRTLAEQDALMSEYAPPMITQKCRESCKNAVEILKPLCIQLSKSIERSRWRGSLRTVLKDASIEKARRRIERAKSNLNLAQMATLSVMSTLNLQQHASTQTLVISAMIMASKLDNGDNVERRLCKPNVAQSTCTGTMDSHHQSCIFNSDTVAQIEKCPARRRSLWLGKRFEIIRDRAGGMSTFTFRTYNILPRDAPVFFLARRGDVAGLQALFQRRDGTIFDRDENGQTLLHHTWVSEQQSMLTFLLQQGCDINETDFWGHTCFYSFLMQPPALHTDTLHALTATSSIDVDPEIVYAAAKWQPLLLTNIVSMASPPWYSMDLATRLPAAYAGCRSSGSLDGFWCLLSQTHLDVSCLTGRIDQPEEVYVSLVERLARTMSAPPCPDLEGWRSLLRSAVELNGFGVAFKKHCSSPMLSYLGFSGSLLGHFYGSLSDLNHHRLSCRIQNWAREVLLAGQDLQTYGHWEQDLLLHTRPEYVMSGYGYWWYYAPIKVRLLNFVYGPSSEDWKIWASTSLDEHAGEFWQGVHFAEPVLAIPGSWPLTNPSHSVDLDLNNYVMSRRGRRRISRYLELTLAELETRFYYEYGSLSSAVEYNVQNGKKKKAERRQFHAKHGITPPYRELVS
ncbi:hypothetical protein EDD36DRAFT_413314 [Exophiala viscosa]|uniref:NACHT-NTPase and P-loop NTPases N-terminal domain-containing protein n=1 Tax=Exophiala viscosa TaxID=2486360 RepID=A0AAN6E676_9EURO|nr:hypothetical protein EDD36DRAFT_413314 [Exophiala viscosa]